MPFALLIIGAVLLISAARGTITQGPNNSLGLFTLIESDFTGSDNFVFWLVALLLIGAVGYVPKLKPISVAFLSLVIIVLFLKKGNASGVGGGFFSQFTQGIASTQSASAYASSVLNSQPTSGANPSATGLGSLLNSNLLGVGGYNSSLYGPSNDSTVLGTNDTSLFNIPSIDSSPVATSGSQGSVLSPAPNDTDVSFPSLGIG